MSGRRLRLGLSPQGEVVEIEDVEGPTCHPRAEDPHNLAREALLEGFLGGDGQRTLLDAEQRGQDQMVESESLPVRTNFCTDADLEAMGVQLGKPFTEDHLFRPAILPDGWEKKPTDHAMWSEVVDARGRKRLSIFYKAAFYDRDAFINAVERYRVLSGMSFRSHQPDYDYETALPYGEAEGDRDMVVVDFGQGEAPVELQRFEVVKPPDKPRELDDPPEVQAQWEAHFASNKEAEKAAEAWVEERYPDWRKPAAYWDEE